MHVYLSSFEFPTDSFGEGPLAILPQLVLYDESASTPAFARSVGASVGSAGAARARTGRGGQVGGRGAAAGTCGAAAAGAGASRAIHEASPRRSRATNLLCLQCYTSGLMKTSAILL